MEYSFVKWFETVGSTNSELAVDKADLPDFATYAAEYQSGGRGQKGNSWHSGKGLNLTFSTLARPEKVNVSEQFSISQAAAMAVVDYLHTLSITATVKWPNDIYVGEKKICGILIENSLEENRITSSIVGIGLNVNQVSFDESLPNPVSLKLITGIQYDVRKELGSLLETLRNRLSAIESGRYRNRLDIEYMESMFRRGGWYDFERMEESDIPVEKRDGHVFRARILGVASDGRLLLENEAGVVETFAFKEIKYII